MKTEDFESSCIYTRGIVQLPLGESYVLACADFLLRTFPILYQTA
jgi:hypothetical protein